MKIFYAVILMFVTSLFLGCIQPENNKLETPSTIESVNPGIFKVSELDNLPKVINLRNNTYLTLTSIDKKSVSGYIEYNGIGTAYYNGQFIFRDKDGRVVQNGAQGIHISTGGIIDAKKKEPISINLPLDLYETWEPRIEGFPIKWIKAYNLLDKFDSNPVELEMNDVSLRGTIEKDSSGINRYLFKGYIENKGNAKKSVFVQLGQGPQIGLNEITSMENMANQPTKEFSDSWKLQKDLIILEKSETQQIQRDIQFKSSEKSDIITVMVIAINQI